VKFNDAKQQRRDALFKQLPPGTQPFLIPIESMKGLDRDTRNALIEEQLMRAGSMRIAIDCPEHRWRPCLRCAAGWTRAENPGDRKRCTFCGGTGLIRRNAVMSFGCKHVSKQDAEHPSGIVFTPKRYYLCKDCWILLEAKRFDLRTEITTLCWDCVEAEAFRIARIDPDLLTDLTLSDWKARPRDDEAPESSP
jgi:hypothetical protein